MSIFSAVGRIINQYGNSVNVENKGKTRTVKAFVQPLRYKNKVYVGGQYHKLGFLKTEKYLYIGPPEILLESGNTVIEMQNRKYIVKRCETYYVKDYAIYIWALLAPYGSPLEDEYESD